MMTARAFAALSGALAAPQHTHGDLAAKQLGIAGWCVAEREDSDDEVLAMAMMCS